MNRLLLMVGRNLFRAPWLYAKLCHYAKHTDQYPEIVKYKHIQYIFRRAVKSGNLDLQVRGLENIPKENGFLVYSNHQGLFDILAIGAYCEQPMAAVLKKELYHIPFMTQIVDSTKSYCMDREDVRQSLKVIQAVTREVQEGRNFLIFPEGTRSKMGNQMIAFHGGSFKCATRAKCPILPIALINTYKVFDEKGCKPVKLMVHYLPPVPYEEYKGMTSSELAVMIHDRIQEAVNAGAQELQAERDD